MSECFVEQNGKRDCSSECAHGQPSGHVGYDCGDAAEQPYTLLRVLREFGLRPAIESTA